ncbi:DMT family transporter [Roseateles chitosanitabidus]|uniref:DMT family transporter n=1 Tax=Roseateles chitosanitabidus TaxID=65048 RepID=UPI000B23CC83
MSSTSTPAVTPVSASVSAARPGAAACAAPVASAGVLAGTPGHPAPAASDALAPGDTATPGPLDLRAIGIMLVLCLTWSLQQISLKAAAASASPMGLVAVRSLIAAALLALLMWRRGERPSRSRWRAGLGAGTLFALEFLLVSQALQLTQASHVVIFLYAAPIFAALGLQARIPAERLSPVQWGGILIAFGGIATAFLFNDGGGAQLAQHAGAARSAPAATVWLTTLAGGRAAILGDALALLASVCWGATTVTIRCSALSRAPASETLLYQLLCAAAILLPASHLLGEAHFDGSALAWSHLAFQTVVVSFASFLTWFWMLRRYLASPLGVLTFLTPLLGVLLGVWLLGERLQPTFLLGGALVLAGILMVSAPRYFSRS